MVGNNSASIVADAYLKGCRGYDAETLWKAVVHGANAVHPTVSSTGRLGYEYYNTLGYVPYDVKINENVARTLEYAYNDWCIYQFGKALGKSEKELKPFRERSFNYKNVFDKETNLMRGRNKDGKFQSPFSPFKWGDAFTEGNSWHYTWSVFHDPQGLINLMGGKQNFNQMLDSVFNVPPVFDDSYYGGVIHEIREMQIMNMGNYAHGTSPYSTCSTSTAIRASPGRPSTGSVRLWTSSTLPTLMAIVATRITDKPRLGMYSRLWASTPYALAATSMCWAHLTLIR